MNPIWNTNTESVCLPKQSVARAKYQNQKRVTDKNPKFISMEVKL